MKLLSVARVLSSSTSCSSAMLGGSGRMVAMPKSSRFLLAGPQRSMSSPAAGGASFDGEMSKIYKVIAENHRHPSGPWVTMLEQVHAFADTLPSSQREFTVLDLATGPGEPAETIARQFPHATVVATDLSPDQVALAQETTLTLPHMTAQVADMENLHQFEDASFDLVTCCYGFMFPPNIPQAIRESHRVLKPGGKLIATTWNRIRMMQKVTEIMQQVMGTKDIPKPPINPLSLSEPGLFEGMLMEAGYTNLEVTSHNYPFDLTADPELQFKAATMTIKAKIDELDAWDKVKEVYEANKLKHGEYTDHGHYILPDNEYKLVVATK